MYFTLPFTMPPDTESLSLTYRYERHHESAVGILRHFHLHSALLWQG